MVRNLRESKAKLSEPSQGQEVLITVRGRVKARLTRASVPRQTEDRSVWLR